MNRRSAIKTLGFGGAVALLGGGIWINHDHQHPELALNLLLDRLEKLDPEAIQSTGAWGVSRSLAHLAQSIDFSITGYPSMKSVAFRNTVGSLAFAVFSANGQMSHGLDQPIPGESVTDVSLSNSAGMAQLLSALSKFDSFEGSLKPHFAYGALTKAEYALAHVMHVNNHFSEFN